MPSLPAILFALSLALLLTWIFIAPHFRTPRRSNPQTEKYGERNKSVLITGCSEKSAGAALAHAFYNRGYTVFATARNTSKIPASLRNLTNVHVLQLDVTDQASIDRAVGDVSRVVGKNGRGLDVLVNSAGMMLSGPGLDVDVGKEGKRCFEVNVWGPVRCMQAFSGLLVKAGDGKKEKATVPSTQPPNPLSESMRLELSPLNICLLTVVVGAIASKLTANQPRFHAKPNSLYAPAHDKIRDFIEAVVPHSETTAEDFAEQVVNDVEKGRDGKVWRGQGVWLIWVLGRWVPRWLSDWVFGAMKGLSGLRRVREGSRRGGKVKAAGWSEKLEGWLEVLA